ACICPACPPQPCSSSTLGPRPQAQARTRRPWTRNPSGSPLASQAAASGRGRVRGTENHTRSNTRTAASGATRDSTRMPDRSRRMRQLAASQEACAVGGAEGAGAVLPSGGRPSSGGSSRPERTVVLFVVFRVSKAHLPGISGGGGVAAQQPFERAQAARAGAVVASQAGVVVDRQRDRVQLEGDLSGIGIGGEFAAVDRQFDRAPDLRAPVRLLLQHPVADRARAVVVFAGGGQEQAAAVILVPDPFG